MSCRCSLAYFTVMSISLHLQTTHTTAFTISSFFLFFPHQETRDSEINYVNAFSNTLINFSLHFAHHCFQKVKASFNQVGSKPWMSCIRISLFCNVIWINIVMKSFNRLCGLVVRVSGYRYRDLGFDSRRYQIFWVVMGLERRPLSLVRSIEELLE